MKPINFLLVLLLLMIGLTAILVMMTEPPNGHGIPHATVPGMQQVGDGWARTGPMLAYGGLLGTLIYLSAAIMLYLGIAESHRTPRLKLAMTAATILALSVWFLMLINYAGWAQGTTPNIILGFPAPTAWTLYGVWLGPIGFTLIYTFGFRHWIFTEEDEARFNELLKQKKNNND